MGGQSFARMDPAGTKTDVADLAMPHNTYQVDIAGDYVGGFREPVPRSLMFRDWFKQRRAAGSPIGSDNKSFLSNSLLQPVDQELVDSLMMYSKGQGR